MSESSSERINRAVRKCLDRCYAAPSPLVEMGLFLEEMRKSGELNESEAAQVQITVSRILGQITGKADSNGSS